MHVRNLAAILAISLALSGYSAWVLAVRPGPTPPLPMPAQEIPLLRRAQAERLWHEPGTLFVDVRSAEDYNQGHIAGALSMPEEEIEDRLSREKPRLERARAIVVYCKNVDCGKSLWAAIRLRNAGFLQTRIYPAGWKEWSLRGLPTAKTVIP